MVSRYARVALIAALLLGAGLRLESLQLDPSPTVYTDLTDEGNWCISAARAHGGGPLVLPGDWNSFLVTPTWTLLLWSVFAACGQSLAVARGATAVCGALAPLALYWALRRDLAPRESALSAVLLSLSFVAIAFSRMAVLEAPAMLLLILTAGAYRRALAGGVRAAVLLALAFAAAMLTKASAVALVPVFVLDALRCAVHGTVQRGAAARAVAATLIGFGSYPLMRVAAAARWPEEAALMASVSVGDKFPALPEIPGQILWYLGFNQLMENAPVIVLCAWAAAGAALWTGLREAPPAADEPERARDGAPFAALWFLGMAGMVALLPYQPKRYHLLAFPPACVLTAVLCIRGSASRIARGAAVAGLVVAALVMSFAVAMGRIHAQGAFVRQPTLHPDNAARLLRDGLVMSAAAAVAILSVARAVRRPLQLAPLMVLLLVLEATLSGAAWLRWRRGSTDSTVRAAREVAKLVRARPPARLAGMMAHVVALETGIDSRWLSIYPRVNRHLVPREPVSHVLLDDPRDLDIWRDRAPRLLSSLHLVADWPLLPDDPVPTRWDLYEVRGTW